MDTCHIRRRGDKIDSMIYTNVLEHGGDFDTQVKNRFDSSKNITIASGYVSLDIIEKYAPMLEKIASLGGKARLLVGMAFYEGLTQKKLTRLQDLSKSLSSASQGSGVFIPYERKYHGKIYYFENDGDVEIFIGSSNFSTSGLKGNMEATAPVDDDETKASILNYIDYLFSEEISDTIDHLEIVVPGSRKYKQKVSLASLDDLTHYDPSTIHTENLEYFDYNLTRIVDKQKSSLNVYFGRGRINKKTGIIRPRSWYEAALISPADVIRNPLYPKGNFTAFTDDGYVIPMSANGTNNKNIQSKGGLKPFGMWIKNKLQNSGALIPLTPVSLDTLEAYGRTNIRFYKIDEGKYYMDFSVNAEGFETSLYTNEDGE